MPINFNNSIKFLCFVISSVRNLKKTERIGKGK